MRRNSQFISRGMRDASMKPVTTQLKGVIAYQLPDANKVVYVPPTKAVTSTTV